MRVDASRQSDAAKAFLGLYKATTSARCKTCGNLLRQPCRDRKLLMSQPTDGLQHRVCLQGFEQSDSGDQGEDDVDEDEDGEPRQRPRRVDMYRSHPQQSAHSQWLVYSSHEALDSKENRSFTVHLLPQP